MYNTETTKNIVYSIKKKTNWTIEIEKKKPLSRETENPRIAIYIWFGMNWNRFAVSTQQNTEREREYFDSFIVILQCTLVNR